MNHAILTQFIQLFTLADTEATRRISERLALVLRDPAAYQEQFAEELEERGIETALPVQELRDIALIDTLLSEDLLWESNWKDPAAEMAGGINEILAQQQLGILLEPATLVGRRQQGAEALDAVQDALEALGLALVLFTLDSDSYPLGVVAEAQAGTLRQLAKELGFMLAVY